MKIDALDNPKLFDLAARLGVSRPTAIGHLELLWRFTARHSPRGDVGRHPNGAIARACDWDDDPDKFMFALTESRWLDASAEHRYLVHDWSDHVERWVLSKLSRAGQSVIKTVVPTASDQAGPTVDRTAEATPSQAKSSQVQPSQEEEVALPDWLDKTAWREWEAYRRESRKPLRPTTIRQQLAFLQQQPNHAAVIRQSIRNQWEGLFALKGRDVPEGPPIGDPAKEKANLDRLAALVGGVKRVPR